MKKQIRRKCVVCKKIKRTTNTKMDPFICEYCLREQAPEWFKFINKAKIGVPVTKDVVIKEIPTLNKGLAVILFLIGLFIGLIVRGIFK